MIQAPKHLDVKRDRGLTVQWADDSTSFFSVNYLRRHSPSAEARELRKQLAANPLAILPTSAMSNGKPLTIENVELVGNYALKIHFSDGHNTGLYSWDYLTEIDPQRLDASSGSREPSA
jgi:DUF971 family protein